MTPTDPMPRRRGRPRKIRPAEVAPASAADAAAIDESAAVPDGSAAGTAGDAPVARAGRQRRPAAPARAPDRGPDGLTIEAIVAIEPPREFRLHPRDRVIAYTADVAGARQLMTMSLRGDPPTQLTASEKPVSDPQWSPDGRRLAFVRDKAIWVVEADGARLTKATGHPAGDTDPRWSPDGRRLAFLSRRRGWSQVWVIDAPIPKRGRPARDPRPPEARAITPSGIDVEAFAWSPVGDRIAFTSIRGPDAASSQVAVVAAAGGEDHMVGDPGSWESGVSWTADGGLLYVSDADGWFQVVRLGPDLRERTILTAGSAEHGEPVGSSGFDPLASPDGERFVHVQVADGYVDLVVAPLAAAGPVKRGPGRPPKHPRPVTAAGAGARVNPWPGVWRAVGWLHDGSAVLAVGEDEGRPQDLWLLPVPGVAGERARPRQLTRSLPAVLRPMLGTRVIDGERVAITARDGLRLEGTLWRPVARGGRRSRAGVPAIVYPHGGPTWQAYRRFDPFKQLLVREGFAVLDVDFRGSTGYGRDFRLANVGEWGHADAFDIVDAGRWLREQPWCDGRLAVWGGSYGGYLVLCALVEAPELWRAGIDLYGDSEIAESYRHGDRIGRLDLHRQMGSPDDPGQAPLFRRGSPVYRAERIEAPLLILHGRKDKRVVPLMTERMIEALEIEGKHYEVAWYDEEAHGWERRETRRDALTRTLTWLRRHVLDDPDA